MSPRFDRVVRFQRHAWIIVGFAMLAAAALSAQIENRARIRDDERLTNQVHELATRADEKAQLALVQDTLHQQKVCSTALKYQREACRDLFERLVNNITPRQRFRLACTVMFEFHDPILNSVRRRAGCPAPTPPRP